MISRAHSSYRERENRESTKERRIGPGVSRD